MKHRSVIAFVIVAAALFSLPQLSHDLQALKGAVGARLHRELLHAFLNLPAGEPAAAAPAGRRAETLLASCPGTKSSAPAAKAGKARAGSRAEGRTDEKAVEQRAMAGDPVGRRASADFKKVEAALTGVRVETEVAMIIPPESGIDPRSLSRALASKNAARVEANRFRAEAEGLRVAYVAAARSDAKAAEWQKSAAEAVRKFNGSLPVTYEFRFVRGGAKAKVLKFKCDECPGPTARAPRPPRPVAATLPPPAPAETAGE